MIARPGHALPDPIVFGPSRIGESGLSRVPVRELEEKDGLLYYRRVGEIQKRRMSSGRFAWAGTRTDHYTGFWLDFCAPRPKPLAKQRAAPGLLLRLLGAGARDTQR